MKKNKKKAKMLRDNVMKTRDVRISYSGDVLYGDWKVVYYAKERKKLNRDFMPEMENEYPFLFLMGAEDIIMTQVHTSFFYRKGLEKVVRIFKELWATNPPEEILTPYDYADALLAHMFLNEEYGVSRVLMTENKAIVEDTKNQKKKYGNTKWYKREIKNVKNKINGRMQR